MTLATVVHVNPDTCLLDTFAIFYAKVSYHDLARNIQKAALQLPYFIPTTIALIVNMLSKVVTLCLIGFARARELHVLLLYLTPK